MRTLFRLRPRERGFAFETTLSGLGYTRWIPLWREGGYRWKDRPGSSRIGIRS